jgi:hypothetical protein
MPGKTAGVAVIPTTHWVAALIAAGEAAGH